MVTHVPTAAYAYMKVNPLAEKKFRTMEDNLCDPCSGFGYINSVLCKECSGEGNKIQFHDVIMELILCRCTSSSQTIIAEDGMDVFQKVTHLCTDCAMVSYFEEAKK